MEKEIAFGKIPPEKIEPDRGEINRRLGKDADTLLDKFGDIVAEIISLSRPRFAARELSLLVSGDTVRLNGTEISSPALARHLSGSRGAYAVAITLGAELDRYIRRCSAVSASRAFVADGYSSALAEAALSGALSELFGGETTTSPFAIGYGDTPLLALEPLLNALSAYRTLGITLSSSSLMMPTKSILVIVGKM